MFATIDSLSVGKGKSVDLVGRRIIKKKNVIGCEKIRTRGSADHVFLDLHVWMPPDMRLTEAHTLSHVVKDRLMARYPQIADAVIHIEPPPSPSAIEQGFGGPRPPQP